MDTSSEKMIFVVIALLALRSVDHDDICNMSQINTYKEQNTD